MTTTRKHYTPTFKAELVQELLHEEQTLNQIASKHGVHPTQLRRWRDAAITAMPEAFDEEDRFAKRLELLTDSYEKKLKDLYAEIGQLSVELNWLKKTVSAIASYW